MFMNCCWRGTNRVVVSAMLCGVSHAQTPAAMPGATAPAATSVTAVHLTALPDATATLTSSAEFASQSLHVLVGRSIFIKTSSRLKRVYVGNPLVVDSFTSSPSQIVVTAKTAGVSSLILWDEAGESTTYFVSSDLDVLNLQKEIQEALPNDNIKVEAQQDRISLSGIVLSDASSGAAAKLAGLYAKDVVNSLVVRQAHIGQVKLKVQIIEIDRSKLDEFGINLFSQGKTSGSFPRSPPRLRRLHQVQRLLRCWA